MNRVSGQVRAGDATQAHSEVLRRRRGSMLVIRLLYLAILLGGALVGYAAGFLSYQLTHLDYLYYGLPVIGMFAGAVIFLKILPEFTASRLRASMLRRRLPVSSFHSFEITDDGLHIESPGVRSVAQWDVVTDLFRSKEHWTFLVDMRGYSLPRKNFPSVEDERVFLRNAFEKMTPEARARSEDAVAAVQG